MAELSPDLNLSHYRIVSKIGAGGMGEVYLAQDTSELGRTVPDRLEEIVAKCLAKEKDERYQTAKDLLIVLALIVGAGFGIGLMLRGRATEGASDSIAVLPFENRSSAADTEYLSDGLAESLIYRLSQLPNLKVSPTSSVMRYKGKGTDVKTIADELGVSAVITGRIAQRGDSLTISVELIDVRNNKLLTLCATTHDSRI